MYPFIMRCEIKKVFIHIVLLVVVTKIGILQVLYGQNTGLPYYTNFSLPSYFETYNSSITGDSAQRILLSNRKGIILFDGIEWEIISVPKTPLQIKSYKAGEIVLVGMYNEIGYISPDRYRQYRYHQIKTGTTYPGAIHSIHIDNNNIYFLGDSAILICDKDLTFNYQIRADKNEMITGIFSHSGRTYIQTNERGICHISGRQLQIVQSKDNNLRKKLIFSVSLNDSITLLATIDNRLSLYDGNQVNPYHPGFEKYLQINTITCGDNINMDYYAIGTLNGGVMVVSKQTGEVIMTANYQTGLPDDEIYAIYSDNRNVLWVSHEKGLSRFNIYSPLSRYDPYPGFEGNLVAITEFQGVMYIGTSEGVFYLDRIRDYDQFHHLFKETRYMIKPSEPASFRDRWQKTKQIWGFSEFQPDYELVRKDTAWEESHKLYTMQSIKYRFTKLPQIKSKLIQFLQTQHYLLAGTNDGLYKIQNNNTKQILKKQYIYCISPSIHEDEYFCGSKQGLFKIICDEKGQNCQVQKIANDVSQPVYSVFQDSLTRLWAGSENMVLLISPDEKNIQRIPVNTGFPERITVCGRNRKPVLLKSEGVFTYDEESKNFRIESSDSSTSVLNYIHKPAGKTWLRTDTGWYNMNGHVDKKDKWPDYLNLFGQISYLHESESDKILIISDNNIYQVIHDEKTPVRKHQVFFKSIQNMNGTLLPGEAPVLDYTANNIRIKLFSPCYLKPFATLYQYRIKGLSENWSHWSPERDINLDFLPDGLYEIQVRAKDVFGRISNISSLQLTVKKPFWKTWWFILIIFTAFTILLIIIVKYRELYLKRKNELLEGIVKKRTETITVQKDKIEKQHKLVLQQKELITSSINYARRIQQAMLPPEEELNNSLPEYFVLYKPKDIVSGDFYWTTKHGNDILVAVADCTGHGVPGAFLSMLGMSLLSKIVNESKITTPHLILSRLREEIKYALHIKGEKDEPQDGMDISVCKIDSVNSKIHFSGAYNPLVIIRNDKIIVKRADRQPVAMYLKEKEFTGHAMQLHKDDMIYLFTDGYADQFGGIYKKKLKSANFKNLLLSLHSKSVTEQKETLEEFFDSWKGNLEQIDDITILGIRHT